MPAHDLAALLSATSAFSGLTRENCQHAASLFKELKLESGEILAREGDPGNALFLVVEGSLRVSTRNQDSPHHVDLGTMGAGAVAGELGLLSGHPRAATMTAEGPTTIASLSRADFDLLLLEHPRDMESVIAWMRRQLHVYQIRTAIAGSPLLKVLSAEARLELEGSFQWKVMRSGETLFRQGDRGDALYLIASGRIQLFRSQKDEGGDQESDEPAHLLTELGKGDVLGEMALLTGEPRSATACAVRDTQLACLDRPSFDQMVSAHPQEMLGLFVGNLADRLRQQNRGRKPQPRPPVTIAVLVCSLTVSEFPKRLADALSVFADTLHLDRASVDALTPERPVAADAADTRLLSWLNEKETRYQHVVYEADTRADPWTLLCLSQADILFVAADAEDDPVATGSLLRGLLQRVEGKIATNLVLVHANSSAAPRNTRKWLNATGVGRHWHVRDTCDDDVARIARSLTGRTVGLCLGGGFALGLAHIGVVQALREMGIPIDYVGGTSMGAIIAAACALHFTREQMLEIMDKGCAHSLKGDYTIPIVSLLTGKKVAHSIGAYLEDRDLEDFWLPYFAISTSLVRARMVIHTRGNALRSVLASCRAPGVFPPLGWGEEVLMDGGLVNNVPCDVMRREVGTGTVIAVDVSPEQDFSVANQFDMHLSGWQVIGRRLNPFSRHPKTATMAGIFVRLVRLGGVAQIQEIRSAADIYLSPPLEQFTFRDFGRAEALASVAYEHTLLEMQQWIDHNGRPWSGKQHSELDRGVSLSPES